MSMSSDEEDIVVPHQDEIRVFPNVGGGVSIQSRGNEDQTVAFHWRHAKAVIAAIREAAQAAREE